MRARRHAIVERPGGTGENCHHAVDVNGGVGKAVQQKLLLCKMIAYFVNLFCDVTRPNVSDQPRQNETHLEK